MGWCKKLAVVLVAIAVGYICAPGHPPPRPDLTDGWYGRGQQKPDDPTIKEFAVKVSDKVLADLKQRLNNARMGEDLENNENFHYGMNVGTMNKVLSHWKNTFDWRKQEKLLNSFPQFKTQIEGIDVHYIHIKPNVKGPTRPLLMTHGWPGSVWEFYKILPLLTDPVKHGGREEDAFEVICPSIPGYGFSEQPHQTGFGVTSAARGFVKLMERLGHKEFYLQGGDWGGAISAHLSIMYPSKVLGVHLNWYPTSALATVTGLTKVFLTGYVPSLFLKDNEIPLVTPPGQLLLKLLRETGYMHIQATKPDTIGMALNDSPMGLAAYILEKFSTWTRDEYRNLPDGGLMEKYTMDELLTNVMIYWVTGTITSSQRLYKEFYNDVTRAWDKHKVEVPAGLAMFPNEIVITPEYQARERYTDIVQLTDMPQGGHFAAFELPQVLAEDIRSFVRKVENRRAKHE